MSPITTAFARIVVGFGIAPQDDVARESVDLIELNHFYDEQGRLVFDQVIFYDWSAADARYNVRAWRLVKNSGPASAARLERRRLFGHVARRRADSPYLLASRSGRLGRSTTPSWSNANTCPKNAARSCERSE